MKRVVLISVAILLTVAAIAVGVFVARHDWAVEELMAEIHAGPSSPYAGINAQSTAADPQWEKLEGVLAPLDEMCRALLAARDATIRDSSVGYVEAVGALRTAITDRDLPAFQTSAQSLRKSCDDCHFQGGVGGELSPR
jgi:hypothetical protein